MYSRKLLQPCFVLHQRAFQETSLIIEVFSEEQGRMSILAKGAKDRNSRFRGLYAFAPLLLSWTGKSDLKLLVDLQPNGSMYWLEGLSLFSGLYINELLMKLLAIQDPYVKLYAYYHQALQGLAGSVESVRIQSVLRTFENILLSEIGYATDQTSKYGLSSAIQNVLGSKKLNSREVVKQLLGFA